MLFSGKIPSYVAARLTARYWVPYLLRFATNLPLFATICHYSPLFETVRHYSHYLRLFVLFGAIRYSGLFAVRCSLFATIRYSLLGFSRHPFIPSFCFDFRLSWKFSLVNLYISLNASSEKLVLDQSSMQQL